MRRLPPSVVAHYGLQHVLGGMLKTKKFSHRLGVIIGVGVGLKWLIFVSAVKFGHLVNL